MKKPILAVLLSIMFIPALLSAQEGVLVASKKSNKYHLETCTSAKKISAQNRIEFKDAKEAAVAGYEPCKTCNPPTVKQGENADTSQSLNRQNKMNTVQDGQCSAITKMGTRCKRKAEPGSIYCWQHK